MRGLIALLLCAALPAAAADLKPWSGGATPALQLEDTGGKVRRLADYRGKVVLVNFWATWCEPCRAEMPSMNALRESLRGRPFEVLAVNLAEPLPRVDKYLATLPLGFPVLRDRDSAASKAWRARMLPASYLVDREGAIRYVAVGVVDWTSEPVKRTVMEMLR